LSKKNVAKSTKLQGISGYFRLTAHEVFYQHPTASVQSLKTGQSWAIAPSLSRRKADRTQSYPIVPN
jgi:hypothetical protein